MLVVIAAMAHAAARYTITVEPAEHGSVASDVAQAAAGTTVSLTVTPDDGYELATLAVEERVTTGSLDDDDAWEPARAPRRAAIATTDAGGGVYTFVMPDVGVKVHATFIHVPLEVVCLYNEMGTAIATPERARPGETVTLSAPDCLGYTFDRFVVMCGDTEVVVNGNSFVMPDGEVTVETIYLPRNYHVVIEASGLGEITTESNVVPVGSTVVLTIVPVSGYTVKEVTVEEVQVVDGTLDDGNDAWEPARAPARAPAGIEVTCHDWSTYSFVMPPYHVRVLTSFAAGPVTAVDSVPVDPMQHNAPCYNIHGQRVGSDYRGVVIQGGTKRLRLLRHP